jgi:hypothetical protein
MTVCLETERLVLREFGTGDEHGAVEYALTSAEWAAETIGG